MYSEQSKLVIHNVAQISQLNVYSKTFYPNYQYAKGDAELVISSLSNSISLNACAPTFFPREIVYKKPSAQFLFNPCAKEFISMSGKTIFHQCISVANQSTSDVPPNSFGINVECNNQNSFLEKNFNVIGLDKDISDHGNVTDILKSIRTKNVNKLIIAQLNINSIRNKLDALACVIQENIDILVVTETKLDDTFTKARIKIDGYCEPFRLDRNAN